MPVEKRTETPDREAFYEAIAPENLRALGPVLGDLVTRAPGSGCEPCLWRYDLVRDFEPVCQMTAQGYVATVHAALPVRSLGDLVQILLATRPKIRGASLDSFVRRWVPPLLIQAQAGSAVAASC